jgi:glutamate---cysteine ligase / carboxylate-amine ligase
VGVEEEFLLIDPHSGAPVPKNTEVARRAADLGVELQLELTTCQVETATGVMDTRDELFREISRLRSATAQAARESGAGLLAVGLPPTVPQKFPITDTPRYREIADRFGMIAHEQGICGCHVHVAVPDRDIAVQVCTWLRPWLPTLLAISANSAIYRNTDTGYASWRSVLWARWPSSGPPPRFASAAEYDAAVATMIDAGAMLDDGMVYWDARPSAKFPTVEVRVADVAASAAETVLLATLTRAAVMTALSAIERGDPEVTVPDHVLRAAYWRSARYGLEGQDAELAEFVAEVRPALETLGDCEYVQSELSRVRRDGNGAMRQRRAWQRSGDIGDVVAAAAAATVS